MKIISKFKSAYIALGALIGTQMAVAQSFQNIPTNGPTLGKISKNVAGSMVDSASAIEAGLYIFGIVFLCLFIFSLVKWKKTDGQQGNMGLISVYLIASVFCIAAPTLIGSGMTTLFGTGTVTTVKPPSASFSN